MIVLTFFLQNYLLRPSVKNTCPAGQEFEALLSWKCIVPESIFQSCNPHFFFSKPRDK